MVPLKYPVVSNPLATALC